MLEELKKKGKPISPKMQQMADWLDSLEAGQDGGGQPGEVRSAALMSWPVEAHALQPKRSEGREASLRCIAAAASVRRVCIAHCT